jgi:hypothetical protein
VIRAGARRGIAGTASPSTGSVSLAGLTGTVTDISEDEEQDALPVVYALELIWPRQAGTTPNTGDPAFPASHRVLWAHSDFPYVIICRPRGGMEPYAWSLSGTVPAGATIDADGKLTIPNPSGAMTFTVNLRDAHNTTVSNEYTVTTDNTRFRFFDSVSGNDTTGTGSISAPWRSLLKIDFPQTNQNQICVFRAGTYSMAGTYVNGVTTRTVTTANFTPTTRSWEVEGTTSVVNSTCAFGDGAAAGSAALVTGGSVQGSNFRVTNTHSALSAPPTHGSQCGVGNNWQRVDFDDGECNKWIVYPGETAILDGNFQTAATNWGAMIRHTGNGTWMSGFTLRGFLDKCFQIATGDYVCFWDLHADEDTVWGSIDGSNSGLIMQLGSATMNYGFYVDIQPTNCLVGALKCYSQIKPRYDRVATIGDQGWDLKATQQDYEVSSSTFRQGTTIAYSGLYGNMAGGALTTRGTIMFCLMDVRDAVPTPIDFPLALDIGQDGVVGPTYVYRCTMLRRFQVRNVNASQGPVEIKRCVILNGDSTHTDRVYLSNTTASRVIYEDNISDTLSSGVVDANGDLTNPAYLGRYGYQKAG